MDSGGVSGGMGVVEQCGWGGVGVGDVLLGGGLWGWCMWWLVGVKWWCG